MALAHIVNRTERGRQLAVVGIQLAEHRCGRNVDCVIVLEPLMAY
jgi:hypothetical protein